MNVYFEEFGFGRDGVNSHLTPNKPYEVIKGSKETLRIYNDLGTVVFVQLNTASILTNSEWKVWTPNKAEKSNMKIYFEEFGEGYSVSYLTPGKLYEVCYVYGDFDGDGYGGCVKITDDVGSIITVRLEFDGHARSSWKVFPEETKTQSAVDIVASLESERNALANSVDSVNELLDSLAVPKAETLRERVTSALADKQVATGTTEAHIVQRSGHIDSGRYSLNPVRVGMKTESGEVVYFKAELGD